MYNDTDNPSRRVVWTLVFVANLLVPLMLGWSTTRNHGRVAMFVAIVMLWFVGDNAGKKGRTLGSGLLVGGVVVGLSQIYPFLQLIAGLIALTVAKQLGQANEEFDVTSELGGFIATTVTGGLLMAAALIIYGFSYLFFIIGVKLDTRKKPAPRVKPVIVDCDIDA